MQMKQFVAAPHWSNFPSSLRQPSCRKAKATKSNYLRRAVSEAFDRETLPMRHLEPIPI